MESAFKTPSETAYYLRQRFHSFRKESTENAEVWYQRIESFLSGCDYAFSRGLNRLLSLAISILSLAISYDCSAKTQNLKTEEKHEVLLEENFKNELDDDFSFNLSHFDNDDDLKAETEAVFSVQFEEKQVDDDKCSNSREESVKRDSDSNEDYETKKKSVKKEKKSVKVVRSGRFCDICQKSFHSQARLERHTNNHVHDGRTFVCYLCTYGFKQYGALRGHYTAKHLKRRTGRNCELCSKPFFSPEALEEHMKIHQGIEKGFECSDCNKVFDTQKRLHIHAKIHSEFKRFICETCGHAVRTNKELDLHRRKHSDARPFECKICGQFLKSVQYMRNHMRLHTGERPFQCELCSKTFVQRANYQKHMRVHRQERNHPCPLCGKRFMTAYDLKVHINVHTGTKPFQCSFCDLSFTQPGTLRHHKLRLHPESVNFV